MKNSRLQKIIILLIIDIFSVALAAIATIALIEPVTGLSRYENVLKIYLPCEIVVTIVVYTIMKLYQSLWRYAGIEEFCNIIISIVIISVGNLGFVFLTKNQAYLPIRFAIINPFLLFCMTALSRYVYRLLRYITNRVMHKHNFGPTRVMVVGAGSAGSTIIKELIDSDKVVKKAVCCIDDNHSKQGTRIHGILVVGGRESIIQMAEKYKVDEIIVAMPSVKAKSRAEILNICKETKCRVKVLPGIFELVNGTVSVSKARDVEIIDLLGREQIEINIDEVIRYIENRVVLVTGGGGSIGSELCRQIASHNPKQLIIVDIYENNAYEIEQEIKRNHPELNLLTLIASIRDKGKVNDIFEKYRPEIVFNAAAHKHVPLMETSPNEAIKNNVFGTLNVAKAANQYGTKRFVQISTDKAVNPTNIMGASKRICEMIIQTIGLHSKTCEFVAVRFGNVLGSNGSVIPLFKRQMAEGGPVTVTHKDIIRYFMTIPEAVSLVLQAGAYAKGGEIFVLDMGEPVRIYDLAVNLIKLSGYTPGVDMEIKITGLRPGEKLYEERLMEEEGLQQTANGLISIAKPIELDEENLWKYLDELYKEAYLETSSMKELVKQLVPTYIVDNKH